MACAQVSTAQQSPNAAGCKCGGGHVVQAVSPSAGSLAAAFPRHVTASMQVDILCSLCTDLLDLNTIIAEIDRREHRGQFVAGKGGIGGANPVRTDAQRVKRMAPRPQVCSLRTSLLHVDTHSAGLDWSLAA